MLRKISLWLLPGSDDEASLRSSINMLSQQQDTIPFTPHLTLYSPILSVPADLQTELEPICQKITPFRLDSQGIGHSDAFYRAIVIEIQANPELRHWQEQLRTRWNPTDQRPFMPHISLVYKDMSANKKRELLGAISYQSTYCFDRLSAIATETSDPAGQQYQSWQVLWTMQLSGKKKTMED